jgi:hypothetical protein
MMSNPNPGFVPQGVYDAVLNRLNQVLQRLELATAENDQLREACAKLQTNSGFKPASEINGQEQDGEARITDQKMLTDFVMNSLKLRPREVVIKYRGSIVLEIRPKS